MNGPFDALSQAQFDWIPDERMLWSALGPFDLKVKGQIKKTRFLFRVRISIARFILLLCFDQSQAKWLLIE